MGQETITPSFASTFKKITYENVEQFLEDINRNFAVVENSPLYKGIPGKKGIDTVGLQGIRGNVMSFVKLESFNTQFPGEINTVSKINIDFINSKLQDFNTKQKLLKSLNLNEFVNSDIVVLSNSIMLSYDIINDKFSDTGIAFNQQSNLLGNIESKIEQYVKYYVDNNSNLNNIQNIFSFYTTYAKNYTDNNGSFVSKSLTASSIYAPFIPGYSNTIGIKLSDHKYFGFTDEQWPKDNAGSMIFGSVKRYFDLLMSTISTAGSETLSSDYAPGVNNIPALAMLQDTYHAGFLFGYKGKTNLKRFGSIYKNEIDELVIKSDSGVIESEFSSLLLHKDYLRYKKLVQFYDDLEVSKNLSVFGNINNKFFRSGQFTSSTDAETSEFGMSGLGTKTLLVSEILQYIQYTNNVLVTDADGNLSKQYSIEIEPTIETQVQALTQIVDNKNSANKFVTSNYLGFIFRKLNSISTWLTINVWRKNQFNTGDIPDLKLSNNFEVGNNIINSLLNVDKPNKTISTGINGGTSIEKSDTVRLEKFINKVLITDGSGNIVKTYSVETLDLTDNGDLNISSISELTTKIPTSKNIGFIARKINTIGTWLSDNVWRKNQFNAGVIPDLKLTNNLEVGNNITNPLLNVDKVNKTISTGINGGTSIEKSDTVRLEKFINKVLVTDGSGNIVKSYEVETGGLDSSEENPLDEITNYPNSGFSILTSPYFGFIARKFNNLTSHIYNNYYTIARWTNSTIPNLILTNRLTAKYISTETIESDDAKINIGAVGKTVNLIGKINPQVGNGKVLVTDNEGNIHNGYNIETIDIDQNNPAQNQLPISTIMCSMARIATSYHIYCLIQSINNVKTRLLDTFTKAESINNYYNHLPKGSIVMWVPTNGAVPSGWVACYGEEYAPFSTYGVHVPDMRDKFVKGENYVVDNVITGGNNWFKLSEEQMPHHKHSINRNFTISGFSHNHNMQHTHQLRYADNSSTIPQFTKSYPVSLANYYYYSLIDNVVHDSSRSYTEKSENNKFISFLTDSFTIGCGGEAMNFKNLEYNEDLTTSENSENNYDWITKTIDNRPAFYTVIYIMKWRNN